MSDVEKTSVPSSTTPSPPAYLKAKPDKGANPCYDLQQQALKCSMDAQLKHGSNNSNAVAQLCT
jgi:hypothetical protein